MNHLDQKLEPDRRAEHALQRARFLSPALRGLLAGRFQARLAGSWASNEAHLPCPTAERIYSLSDVDVLVDALPTVDESATIARSVLNLASLHGVVISKVSVRSGTEIGAFWNPDRVGALAEDPREAGRYLTFWALIGAIEALSSPAAATESERAYVVIKFFFKLCRNLLLMRRCNPRSYRELTREAFAQLIPHPSLFRAYAIKIGRETSMPVSDCEALLSYSNWEPLTEGLIDTRSGEELENLRKEIRTWYRTGISLGAASYLARISTFEVSPELLPAVRKAEHDHELRSTRGAA